MSDKKRNHVWDIAKGLGILFVVAGHGFGGDISRFVNLFHISLFFFISGLLFRFDNKSLKAFFSFLLKLIKSLWLPSLIYGAFYVVMHNPFVAMNIYEADSYSLKQTFISILKHLAFLKTEPLESAMWFLTAIFAGKILLYGMTWIASFFDSKRKIQVVIEIVFTTLVFSAGCISYYLKVSIPGNINNACTLFPCLFLGYKLKSKKITRFWPIIPCIVTLLCILIFSGKTLWMSRNEIVDPVFFLIVSSVGIYFTFILSSMMNGWNPCRKLFCYIGKNTIPILCLHLLAFRLVSLMWIEYEGLSISLLSKHPIIESSYFWGAVYTIIGIAFPLIVPVVKNVISKHLLKKGSPNG